MEIMSIIEGAMRLSSCAPNFSRGGRPTAVFHREEDVQFFNI